jgi:hypothetical protein
MATDKNFGQFTTLDNNTLFSTDNFVGKSSLNGGYEQQIQMQNIGDIISKNFIASNSVQVNALAAGQTQDIYMGGNDIQKCINLPKAWVNFDGFGSILDYLTLNATNNGTGVGNWSVNGTLITVSLTGSIGGTVLDYSNFLAVNQQIIVSDAKDSLGNSQPNLNGIWVITSITPYNATKKTGGTVTFNIKNAPTNQNGGNLTINPNPIYASYNVSSITKYSTGQYKINYLNPLNDVYYSYSGMLSKAGNNYSLSIYGSRLATAGSATSPITTIENIKTTTSTDIAIVGNNNNTGFADCMYISFVVIGN